MKGIEEMVFRSILALILLVAFTKCHVPTGETSPRSNYEKYSLKNALIEYTNWQFCTVTKIENADISKHKTNRHLTIRHRVFCSQGEVEIQIETLGDIYVKDRLLIFDSDAELVLLPGYKFRPSMLCDVHTKTSDLGTITTGLRIMNLDISGSTESFVMVPNFWKNPALEFDSVGVANDNFEIKFPCDTSCGNAAFYLVPVKDLS